MNEPHLPSVEKAEVLFLAAARLADPTNDDPSWIHLMGDTCSAALATWMRRAAMLAAQERPTSPESLAFAHALLGKAT